MNKSIILEQILSVLRCDLTALQSAVKTAHESATHGESVAENKYDTRGLEAAYLAHGQAKRAEQIEVALRVYEAISPQFLQSQRREVGLSSLVLLTDHDDQKRWLWLGEDAGGLKFSFDNRDVTIVTPNSPLGAALMGRKQGDAFELRVADNLMEYEVISLH